MGAGQGKPQYPNWRCFEITEATLPAIRAALGVARNNMLVQKLVRTAEAMPPGINRCEELLRAPGNAAITIDNLTSYNIAGGMRIRQYIVVDTVLQYPVGFMSLKVGNPLINTVFRHRTVRQDGAMILALGAYIFWTCSFTNSMIACTGGRVMGTYYTEQAVTYKLNVANFLTDYVGRTLLEELNAAYAAALPNEVKNVIFYSIGIEGSRARHRKNGKLDACRFMDEWITILDNETLPDKFEYPAYNNTMYYFYMNNGLQFNLSPLQRKFITEGEDISQPNGTYPVGHPNFFDDENFSCPHGEIAGGRRKTRRRHHKSYSRK
jgi:hypothetical protein